MAKFTDEVQLIMSARDEQIDAMRKAERNAMETERRQARREKEAINRAKKQTKQREQIQKEGYDKAEQNAREGGNRVANAFESPLLKAALRATAAFGSLELGVGGVNALVGVMKGDLEGAAEAVKQLPAGIGPFARQLETLLGTVTGISQEIATINQITANLEAASAARSKNALADLRAQAAEFKRLRDLRQDTELRGITDSTAKQRRTEEFRAQNAIADLNAEIEELNRKRSETAQKPLFSDEEKKRIEELQEEIGVYERRRREALEAGFNEGNSESFQNLVGRIKEAQKELTTFNTRRAASRGEVENIDRQIARAEQRRVEVARNNAARSAELERDIAQREADLRQAARDKETEQEAAAQKERLKLYEDAVKARKKFEEDLAKQRRADAIEANRDQRRRVGEQRSQIEAEIARLRSTANTAAPQNTADQRRFLTGVSERSSQLDRQTNDPQREQIKVLEKQLTKLDNVDKRLAGLEDALRNGPRVVGANFGSNN